MDDPVRLRDEGDALEIRVLRSAHGDAPTARVRERALAIGAAAAVATGSAAAVAGTGGAGTAMGGAGALGALGAAKWVAVVVVVGAATVGATKLAEQPRVEAAPVRVAIDKAPEMALPPAAPVARAAPTVEEPLVPRTPAPPSAISLPAPPGTAVVRPRPALVSAPHSDLLEELAFLDRARAALDSGDTVLAIRELDRHDLEYLHGQLASDALALRIEVYASRRDEAKVTELARSFLARFPDHPQAPLVRRLVEHADGVHNP
jgi:hypothetical protein